MKVKAERIGNSKKERIIVDGEVFLKSVGIGKWNYIIALTMPKQTGYGEADESDTSTFWGKSATYENAIKWQPYGMSHECHKVIYEDETKEEAIARCKKAKAAPGAYEKRIRSFGRGRTIIYVPYVGVTREVEKVERDYEI